MSEFLEKVFSWRPLAGSSRRRSRRNDDFEIDRSTGRRPPVPRREVLIAICAGMNLVLLPWFISGVPFGAQVFAFAMSVLAFAFLFLPVGYDEWRSRSASESLSALVRCIPFWIGLVLAVYLTVQGLNTRASVEIDGRIWQVIPLDYVTWLPSSLDAPAIEDRLGGMNTWRTMLIFGAPFLTFIALWVGVRSRRTVLWLTRVTVASVVVMALFAVGMRAGGEQYLYNSISIHVGTVYGPFTYQNQGGAFFYVAFLLTGALALREWRNSGFKFARGGSHYVIGASACLVGFAAVYSASFAATIMTALAVCILVPAWFVSRPKATGASRITTAVIFLLVVGTFAFVLSTTDFEPIWNKLLQKTDLAKSSSLDDRSSLREATMMLYRDMPAAYGSGAGTYRWVMLPYFAKFPEFCSPTTGRLLQRALYAHCDWLQLLSEWGAFGLTMIVGGLVWFLNRMRVWKVWRTPIVWPLLAGMIMLLAHAWMDYLFFNPALCMLFAFVAFVTLSWARDASNASRR